MAQGIAGQDLFVWSKVYWLLRLLRIKDLGSLRLRLSIVIEIIRNCQLSVKAKTKTTNLGWGSVLWLYSLRHICWTFDSDLRTIFGCKFFSSFHFCFHLFVCLTPHLRVFSSYSRCALFKAQVSRDLHVWSAANGIIDYLPSIS